MDFGVERCHASAIPAVCAIARGESGLYAGQVGQIHATHSEKGLMAELETRQNRQTAGDS